MFSCTRKSMFFFVLPQLVGWTILVSLSLFWLTLLLLLLWRLKLFNSLSCRLRSSLWLQFKPHHIAAGAVYLAAKFLNLDLASYQNIWQEFQTTPSIIQGIPIFWMFSEIMFDFSVMMWLGQPSRIVSTKLNLLSLNWTFMNLITWVHGVICILFLWWRQKSIILKSVVYGVKS